MLSLQPVWPPYCCVPAFVYAALTKLGAAEALEPPVVARDLGVTVGPTDDNPWELPVEIDESQRGLPPRTACRTIPSLLQMLHVPLAFRHIPFNTIALGLYEDAFSSATDLGAIVGVGYDHAYLRQDSSGPHRHVARVVPSARSMSVTLVDDAASSVQPSTVAWDLLESAVKAVDDGFWMIGPAAALQIPHTLPWHES